MPHQVRQHQMGLVSGVKASMGRGLWCGYSRKWKARWHKQTQVWLFFLIFERLFNTGLGPSLSCMYLVLGWLRAGGWGPVLQKPGERGWLGIWFYPLDYLTKASSQAHGLQLLEILESQDVKTSTIKNKSTRNSSSRTVLICFLLPGTPAYLLFPFLPFRSQFEGHQSRKPCGCRPCPLTSGQHDIWHASKALPILAWL